VSSTFSHQPIWLTVLLPGNPLDAGFITEPAYNLIYLELAACRLTTLPAHLSSLVPNLRALNLNYNFLTDVSPLEGLVRLRKLTIIGSRLAGTKGVIKVLQKMPEMELVDFRYAYSSSHCPFFRRVLGRAPTPCTLSPRPGPNAYVHARTPEAREPPLLIIQHACSSERRGSTTSSHACMRFSLWLLAPDLDSG
jgi:hypothetical protein